MGNIQLLDFVLASSGLLMMLAYHFWLIHRIIKHPTRTVIGVNAINRRFWVQAMMEDASKNGVLAVQTLRNNIMASTLLASTAIMLSSLIAVLMTGGNGDRSMWIVFGAKSELFFSIKFFLILVCFLVAFLLNVQSIRYYSHASILINVPFKKMYQNVHHHQLTSEYVARTVNKGSYFWSLGLRAFYFSFPLLLWIFGPIPMFLSCFFLVFMLYFLDVTFEFGWAVAACNEEDEDEEMGRVN
ncbi:uncharacterized protein LOC116138730 isoform X1 [Pistacia vera]|uniref:Uncharacterized protein n=2 Tax=Pistacia TaxID=55512 RepID=A0ACC1BU28_9ROSI|nr:uncharacterized protein LOC116138730 isoform X1 [Pistacia vera]KAJ0046439.1 hypothetical protein Pint_05435 [Pistacia integerrima]KAJ0102602.1 hypothetical protein Patl1_05534 [Pistacia atlantica]